MFLGEIPWNSHILPHCHAFVSPESIGTGRFCPWARTWMREARHGGLQTWRLYSMEKGFEKKWKENWGYHMTEKGNLHVPIHPWIHDRFCEFTLKKHLLPIISNYGIDVIPYFHMFRPIKSDGWLSHQGPRKTPRQRSPWACARTSALAKAGQSKRPLLRNHGFKGKNDRKPIFPGETMVSCIDVSLEPPWKTCANSLVSGYSMRFLPKDSRIQVTKVDQGTWPFDVLNQEMGNM